MTEKLLQYIWQNRYYNSHSLELMTGESVIVDYPGELNTQQGPDFMMREYGSATVSGSEISNCIYIHRAG